MFDWFGFIGWLWSVIMVTPWVIHILGKYPNIEWHPKPFMQHFLSVFMTQRGYISTRNYKKNRKTTERITGLWLLWEYPKRKYALNCFIYFNLFDGLFSTCNYPARKRKEDFVSDLLLRCACKMQSTHISKEKGIPTAQDLLWTKVLLVISICTMISVKEATLCVI